MADIFEEVDESLRKDDTAAWWKKYGIFVWIACIGLVLAVAYYEWSDYQRKKTVEAQIIEFEKARDSLAAGEYQVAQEKFAEIANSDLNIAPLAAQYLARTVYEGNGDVGQAVQTLEQSQADNGPFARIGKLKAAYLLSEGMTLTELETYLGDLTSEPSAVGALALELVAAKAFKDGDYARARLEFNSLLLSANAPRGVKERASIAIDVLPVVLPEPSPGILPEPVPVETQDAVETPNGEETEQ